MVVKIFSPIWLTLTSLASVTNQILLLAIFLNNPLTFDSQSETLGNRKVSNFLFSGQNPKVLPFMGKLLSSVLDLALLSVKDLKQTTCPN